MGRYLNPGNDLFEMSVRSKIYVDKSMMIELTNSVLRTDERHLCISRPRRFGKSMAANMLTAYYSRGCDSRELFSKLKIAKTEHFEEHLNQYNVIKIDISVLLSEAENPRELKKIITEDIIYELCEAYPDIKMPPRNTLEKALFTVYNKIKIPFIFIIDEWDSVFRVFQRDTEGQKYYLDFLRDLLKEKDYVALNYATGIFPIKKYGEHSALNMYREYSVIDAIPFSEFMGFTEKEVIDLCKKYQLSYDEMKDWYNGYLIDDISIYNPQSVVFSSLSKKFNNYWTKTESFEALKVYIQMDMYGLREQVIKMISGEKASVNTAKFQNDMVSLSSADDVLTLLIHLGYLTYDFEKKVAWIPNKEVQQEFINCIEDGGWEEVMNSIRESENLLNATIKGDAEKVASIVEEVHRTNASIIAYNNELSLSVTLSLAYYSARNKYEIIREFPSGDGFADLAFIPRKGVDSPAMIIELKYGKSAECAIQQIKDKHYIDKLTSFSGDVLLVGINYDKETKCHECLIEKTVK